MEMWSCRQNVVRRHLCPSSPSPHGRVLCCCNKTYLEKLCRGIDLTWGGVAAVTYSLQGCQREFVKFQCSLEESIRTLGVNGKYIQSVSKKMSFIGKRAITTFKLFQNANVGGVLENSGYLLPDGHRDFQN